MRGSIIKGLIASLILLSVYFVVLSLVSGWSFMLTQFVKYWYFVLALSAGFGIQVGLYIYIKRIIKNRQEASGKMLAVSGATSTAAMISCCSHYLINLLPILGVAGVVALISQYQVQLFWVGLIFNLTGIVYMLNKLRHLNKPM